MKLDKKFKVSQIVLSIIFGLYLIEAIVAMVYGQLVVGIIAMVFALFWMSSIYVKQLWLKITGIVIFSLLHFLGLGAAIYFMNTIQYTMIKLMYPKYSTLILVGLVVLLIKSVVGLYFYIVHITSYKKLTKNKMSGVPASQTQMEEEMVTNDQETVYSMEKKDNWTKKLIPAFLKK